MQKSRESWGLEACKSDLKNKGFNSWKGQVKVKFLKSSVGALCAGFHQKMEMLNSVKQIQRQWH